MVSRFQHNQCPHTNFHQVQCPSFILGGGVHSMSLSMFAFPVMSGIEVTNSGHMLCVHCWKLFLPGPYCFRANDFPFQKKDFSVSPCSEFHFVSTSSVFMHQRLLFQNFYYKCQNIQLETSTMELLTLSMDSTVDKIMTSLGSDNNQTIISDKKKKQTVAPVTGCDRNNGKNKNNIYDILWLTKKPPMAVVTWQTTAPNNAAADWRRALGSGRATQWTVSLQITN